MKIALKDGTLYLCAKLNIVVVSQFHKVWTTLLLSVPDNGVLVDLLDSLYNLPTVGV